MMLIDRQLLITSIASNTDSDITEATSLVETVLYKQSKQLTINNTIRLNFERCRTCLSGPEFIEYDSDSDSYIETERFTKMFPEYS